MCQRLTHPCVSLAPQTPTHLPACPSSLFLVHLSSTLANFLTGKLRNPEARESPRVKQGVIGRVGLGSRSPCGCQQVHSMSGCLVCGGSKGTFSSFPLLQPVVHLSFLQQVNGFGRVWGFWFHFKHWIPRGAEENTLYLVCPV